jgi:hypothetical protein
VDREVSKQWVFERWPEGEGFEMQFRLVVRGALPPESRKNRNLQDKHRIRREVHLQMRAFWQQHPSLKVRWIAEGKEPPLVQQHADEYARYGFRWVPLVPKGEGVSVSLNILVLRREDPYRIFEDTGDIDNRIKTLLDGLRMPRQLSELDGATPQDGEDPFFVVMEDDVSVAELNVTTDRLFVPPEPLEPHRDVVAVIHVKTKVVSGAPIMNIHSFD